MVSAVARATVLCWSLLAASAQAGSFQVNPVRLSLSAAQPTTAFTVTNQSEQQLVVQLQVMAWSQHDGQDVYTDTHDMLVTPPIFQLEPGRMQTVRAGLRQPPPTLQELAYRVYVQEILPPPEGKGVQIALRVGIPVFVMPTPPVLPVLHWQARQLAQDTVHLRLHNDGNAHIQVQELRLWVAEDAATPVVVREATYILPGQHQQWRVEPRPTTTWAGKRLSISTRTDQGTFRAEIDVEAP